MMMMILANVALPAPSLHESKVPARHAGTGDRLIPNLFVKPGAETLAIMIYVSTPMASSAACKKLDQERESALEEQKTSRTIESGSGSALQLQCFKHGPASFQQGPQGCEKIEGKSQDHSEGQL